jgi:MFS family permease
MATSTTVLYCLHRLMVPRSAYGFLLVIGGIGALLGAFAAPKLSSRFGRNRTLAVMICLSSAMLLFQGLIPNVAAFAVFAALGGFSMSNWNILLMSTYHQMIPNEIFGRIHGTRRTLVWGMMPIGALLGGALAKIDLQTPWIVGGLIATLVSGLSIRFLSSMQTDKVG